MKPKPMAWTPKRLLIVAGLIGACTQIGHLWTFANWSAGTPRAAYAGEQTAKQTKDQFERYLEKQDAVADALKDYVANQQQQAPAAASGVKEWDGAVCWACVLEDREACWDRQLWRHCE
jgi:hypothetical protein